MVLSLGHGFSHILHCQKWSVNQIWRVGFLRRFVDCDSASKEQSIMNSVGIPVGEDAEANMELAYPESDAEENMELAYPELDAEEELGKVCVT